MPPKNKNFAKIIRFHGIFQTIHQYYSYFNSLKKFSNAAFCLAVSESIDNLSYFPSTLKKSRKVMPSASHKYPRYSTVGHFLPASMSLMYVGEIPAKFAKAFFVNFFSSRNTVTLAPTSFAGIAFTSYKL